MKAAASAGPVQPPDPLLQLSGGPRIDDAHSPGPVQQVGMTLAQYGIAWERALKYCVLLEEGVIHPNQPVVHPGASNNIYWVYSETEAKSIEPLCPEIFKLRDAMNVYMVHIYWDANRAMGVR
jgi:hypothetical protein